MSVNANFGIPDARAKEISKEYSSRIRPIFEKGGFSESQSLEIIMGMNLTPEERTWIAYHVGGINRMILYGKATAKQIIIQW